MIGTSVKSQPTVRIHELADGGDDRHDYILPHGTGILLQEISLGQDILNLLSSLRPQEQLQDRDVL